jgi:hypothetical protein
VGKGRELIVDSILGEIYVRKSGVGGIGERGRVNGLMKL